MVKLERFFTDREIVCYAPCPFKYRDPQQPSVFVDSWFSLPFSEKIKESRKAEIAHFEKIDRADITYIVNPSGYVGNSVVLEIGYAYAKGKMIYSQETVVDYAVMSLILQTISPEDLADILKREQIQQRQKR